MRMTNNIIILISSIITLIGLIGCLNALIFIIPNIYLYQAFLLNGSIALTLSLTFHIFFKD